MHSIAKERKGKKLSEAKQTPVEQLAFQNSSTEDNGIVNVLAKITEAVVSVLATIIRVDSG